MKNDKVIHPDDFAFVPNGNAADKNSVTGDLEAAVANTSMDWEANNMLFLAEKIEAALSAGVTEFSGKKALKLKFGEERILLPYALFLDYDDGDARTRCISLRDCEPGVVIDYLCKEYGSAIRDTDLFEMIGLLHQESINLQNLSSYFPAIENLCRLDNKYVKICGNPWLPLLAMDVAERPFFAGVLQSMGKKATTEKSNNPKYFKPATLKEIVNYASRVGELKKVGSHLMAYQEI